MSPDIWKELEKLGISPCDGTSEIEIDRHRNVLRFRRSYFFNCFKSSNGIEFHNIFLAIKRNDDVIIDVQEMFFTNNVGLGGNKIVHDQIKNLTEVFTTFLKNIGDL